MTDDKSFEDISRELADQLGLDAGESPSGNPDVDAFFAEAKKLEPEGDEPETEEHHESSAPKFVHEPTGKEFDTEAELLKYDSGYNNNKFGTKIKELEQELAELRAKRDEKRDEPPVDQRELRNRLKRELFPSASEDVLNDPSMDLITEGLERAAGMMQQQYSQELAKRDAIIERLSSHLEETSAKSGYQIDPAIEQKILEKHPALKSLAPRDRVAMIADYAQLYTERSPKLADRIPRPNPADHVESSVKSAPPTDSGAHFEDKMSKLSEKQQLGVFGKLFEESEIGQRIRERHI